MDLLARGSELLVLHCLGKFLSVLRCQDVTLNELLITLTY
jgi:hypothetical protein